MCMIVRSNLGSSLVLIHASISDFRGFNDDDDERKYVRNFGKYYSRIIFSWSILSGCTKITEANNPVNSLL